MKHAPKILALLIFVLASYRLMREAYFHSTDLHVYWKSAHLWLEGINPYLYNSSDGGNVYKYPPWTIPLFFPLGLISFELTQCVWVIAEILSIIFILRWVVRTGARLSVTIAVALLFWWTWLGHVFAGQFSIFMMLAALWAVPPEDDRELSSAKVSFLAVVFSSKVYSVFTLLGLSRTYLKKRTILISLGLVIFLEAIVFAVLWVRGNPVSVLELHQTWVAAAKSGAAELHGDVIRGPGNHSFTAVLLRWFQVDAMDSAKDVYVALGLGVFFSTLWFHFSKALPRAEKWVGWIAVGMVVHPLLWHHSIVMAFPLCAIAVDRAVRIKNRSLIALSVISVVLVAVLIPNLFGPDFVKPFELLGSKSWGMFLAALVLVLKSRLQPKSQEGQHLQEQP